MICYQCGSKLGSGRYCLRCGADITVYRKIVHISNNYYNAGLEKARLRDLTGAVAALSKSLQFDKRNTDARNLLGLVYYEMGEVVEALSQWVISKNFKPSNNLADEYLSRLQEDRNQLENMNQAIKKFNQALFNAKNDGVDLAVIQLKRVIRQHPHLIKAYQLLALLYIEDGDYSRASRLLKRALKIDQGNTLCMKYTRLIRGKIGKSKSAREKSREPEPPIRKKMVSEEDSPEPDVIVPAYRERSGGLRVFLGVLAGIAIAACMYQFVIVRTMNRNANIEDNQAIASYVTKLADKELTIQTLTTQVEELQKEMENMEETLATYTDSADGVLTQYDALLEVVEMYMSDGTDETELAAAFSAIDAEVVSSSAFTSLYETIEQYVTVDMVESLYNEGLVKYNSKYYKDAITIFEQCLELNPDHDAALYYLGLSYEKRNQEDDALKCFQKIVDDHPDSSYYKDAQKRVEQAQEEQDT